MSDAFLAGLVVGFVLGVIAMFVGLVALAWRDEKMMVRTIKGDIELDDD